MPYSIGLTGGIGSGKSAVAAMFKALGADIVDTDEISHSLTAAGGAAMAAIRNAFGTEYLASDGSLDRARMRSLVFGDPAARKKLEAILHPMIRERTRAAVAASSAPYVVVVVPLLFETGAYQDLVQRVLAVDCDEDIQLRRVLARGLSDEAEARRIISAQISRADRVSRASDVIANNGSFDELRGRVGALHERYQSLARSTAQQLSADGGRSGPGNRA